MPGTRGGVRTEEEAIALMSAIDALPQLRLRGVEAFEGWFRWIGRARNG